LDVGVGDIRIGLNGKIVEGDDAPYKEDHSEAEHKNAIVQRQINQVTDHLLCVASESKNSVAVPRRGIGSSIAVRRDDEALKRLGGGIFR
jgi:hypothetical protein